MPDDKAWRALHSLTLLGPLFVFRGVESKISSLILYFCFVPFNLSCRKPSTLHTEPSLLKETVNIAMALVSFDYYNKMPNRSYLPRKEIFFSDLVHRFEASQLTIKQSYGFSI